MVGYLGKIPSGRMLLKHSLYTLFNTKPNEDDKRANKRNASYSEESIGSKKEMTEL